MYLNKFDFLNNAVGIKTAAYTYFGCEPKDLKIEEAATLVGMCKNPSLYNPVRYNERSRGRRNVVLDQMRKAGYITVEERDSLQALPLKLSYHRVDHNEGLATYFREYLRGVLNAKKPDKSDYRGWQMQKYYEDSLDWETNPLFGWCEKNTKKDGSKYNLYTDGLKIYTTIDSPHAEICRGCRDRASERIAGLLLQREERCEESALYFPFDARTGRRNSGPCHETVRPLPHHEESRSFRKRKSGKRSIRPEQMSVFSWSGEKDTVMTPMDSIRYYKFFLRAGFMSMDPRNGHVKAYVGGPNHHYFKYDMAMVGRRQIGSTMKPYVYSLAMENGFSPCDQARHVEYTLIDENGKPWTPRNANKKRYGDMVTVKWGLANSDNWITAYLMSKLNPYELEAVGAQLRCAQP